MTTFKTENWNKPTPPIWRNIGDALLALSAGINSSAWLLDIIPDNIKVWVVPITTLTAIVGKFLTKLFSNE